MDAQPPERVPPIVRKFRVGMPFEFDPDHDWDVYERKLFFFYGTLMDPTVLSMVLRLRDRPKLTPAKIVGYNIMMWGQYPALLVNPGVGTVYGMAYEVQSRRDEERLEAYETDHYKNSPCAIELQDGREVLGRTFRWVGDLKELKEGTFELKEWQMNRLEV